jgi:Spy/CpxP family protein refolding chaperone
VKRGGAIASILAIFAIGVVVGGLAMHLYYSHQVRHGGPFPGMGSHWLSDDLARNLNLNDQQQKQIDGILEEARNDARQLRAQVTPRLNELMQRTHARIAQVLTPEQKAKFEQYHLERHDRMRRSLAGAR